MTDNNSTQEAGQEGFEPPSPGFGVRCSNRSSYWPVCLLSLNTAGLSPVMLPRFSVWGMLAAKTTIFLEFKPIRGTTLIFCGCVVTAFTLIARQDHHLPHSAFLSSRAGLEPSVALNESREYPLYACNPSEDIYSLRQDVTDDAGAHRAPTLANGKPQLLL